MNPPSSVCSPFLRSGSLAIAMLTMALAPASMAATDNLLTNPSFDIPGGEGWSKAADWLTDPFIIPGQVSLSPSGGLTGTLIWQTLNIPNPSGAQGTASVYLYKNAGLSGNTIALYLDYLDSGGVAQRYLLLNPSNDSVLLPDGALFETSFTVPAGAQSITGFSVDKISNGSFYATDFSLTLQVTGPPAAAPIVTMSSPMPSASYASGVSIPLAASVMLNGASVTGVEFFDNGTSIGAGKLSIYGTWTYSDASPIGSSIIVQAQPDNSITVIYTQPPPGATYSFKGSISSENPLKYFGTWSDVSKTELPGGIDFTSGSNCTLDTSVYGQMVGPTDLTGGTSLTPKFTLSWSGATSGPHALTAKAYYGTDQFVSSIPVNITVTGASGFSDWAAHTPGLPEGNRDLMDHNGPLDMQNLTAYAMGLNPMVAVSSDLPRVTSINQEGGTLHFIYRCGKNLSDAMLIPRFSTDLKTWTNANVLSQSTTGGGSDWDLIDATIAFTPGVPAFIKLAAQTMP